MDDKFSSDFFRGNRQRLRQLYKGNAPIVVAANGLLQRSGDNSFTFQQDANFWYLCGINEPDLILVIEADSEYLMAPARTEVQDIFEGSLDWNELKRLSGIKEILPSDTGWRRLTATLKRAKAIATPQAPPGYIEEIGLYTNPGRARLSETVRSAYPGTEFIDIRPQLADMRVIKQPPEITAIKKAVRITCRAFKEVQERAYDYEYQLEADLSQLFRTQGGTGHAYPPIVASGLNACTLHYSRNDARLRKGRLVLVDAGAQYSNYAADITRTWAIGRQTDRQRAVVSAVNEALELGLSLLKPGVSFMECELQIRQHVGRKLQELKLISRLRKDSIRQYYPHSPHYLGLDVHDVGDYKRPLEPGMVLTLEPGIYIPEEFIGVRIEEDILITSRGCEVLSSDLPRIA